MTNKRSDVTQLSSNTPTHTPAIIFKIKLDLIFYNRTSIVLLALNVNFPKGLANGLQPKIRR